jgi:putative transposase
MDGMLSNMEKVLEAKNIFERERKSMKTRALGVILYHFGISLRNTSLVISSFEQASHEAVREWYLRAAKIFQVRKVERKIIAIDETKIKINGKWRILWAAVDIENWDVLGVWVTQGRSSFEAYSFIRYVLNRCENKPKILVDGGPWYPPALTRLGVEWEHITFGLRNPVEQWFGILKHRINLFYNRWPHNASLHDAQSWIEAFVALYHVKEMLT